MPEYVQTHKRTLRWECGDCGALVADRNTHNAFHRSLLSAPTTPPVSLVRPHLHPGGRGVFIVDVRDREQLKDLLKYALDHGYLNAWGRGEGFYLPGE